MATMSLDETLDRLRSMAAQDADVAEALALLAEDDRAGDPFAAVTAELASGVRDINRRRLRLGREALRERSLTTAGVVAFIASISDRRGVDRRRKRGRLLSIKEGRDVLHPVWQLDEAGADTWPGLARVLEALADVAPDARAADALMVAPRADLAGRTIAQLLADSKIDLAVRLIRMSGDQS